MSMYSHKCSISQLALTNLRLGKIVCVSGNATTCINWDNHCSKLNGPCGSELGEPVEFEK